MSGRREVQEPGCSISTACCGSTASPSPARPTRWRGCATAGPGGLPHEQLGADRRPNTWPASATSGSRRATATSSPRPGRGGDGRTRGRGAGVRGARRNRGAHPPWRPGGANGSGRRRGRRVRPGVRLRAAHRRVPGRAQRRPAHRHQRRPDVPDARRARSPVAGAILAAVAYATGADAGGGRQAATSPSAALVAGPARPRRT